MVLDLRFRHDTSYTVLWEVDRALLVEHGPWHIQTISAVALSLRAEGKHELATELAFQCARMRIILRTDPEFVLLDDPIPDKSLGECLPQYDGASINRI